MQEDSKSMVIEDFLIEVQIRGLQYMRRKLLVLMSQHAACLYLCVCACVYVYVCAGERQLLPDGTDRRITEEFLLSKDNV